MLACCLRSKSGFPRARIGRKASAWITCSRCSPGTRERSAEFAVSVSLYVGSACLARARSTEELLADFQHFVEEYVTAATPSRLFLHSGAVGWRGEGILLPGASGTGKSTLVAALLRAGAEYYSDEYAVLDRDGRVHPYPRRLPEAPSARTGRRPLPVGLVAFLPYRPGARWRPRTLSSGAALLSLLANAPAARIHPAQALDSLVPVARGVPVLRGARGEANEAVGQILRFLAEK